MFACTLTCTSTCTRSNESDITNAAYVHSSDTLTMSVVFQGLPGCLPWGMILTFMNDFLAQVRVWEQPGVQSKLNACKQCNACKCCAECLFSLTGNSEKSTRIHTSVHTHTYLWAHWNAQTHVCTFAQQTNDILVHVLAHAG